MLFFSLLPKRVISAEKVPYVKLLPKVVSTLLTIYSIYFVIVPQAPQVIVDLPKKGAFVLLIVLASFIRGTSMFDFESLPATNPTPPITKNTMQPAKYGAKADQIKVLIMGLE